jgi:prepilin-type N-terminal cleavage/methylation domain-containing protein
MRGSKCKHQQKAGFTLVELLVVIAIIGILSTVVLVSLTSARTKARDAKRVASLHEMAKLIAVYDNDPANVFWTTVNGATQCATTAYTDVVTCLAVGRTGVSTATNFNRYVDPTTSGTTCKGTASGASSTVACQYSLSTATGAGSPNSQNYQICSFLEVGAGRLPSGLVSVSSNSGSGVVLGCN